MCNVCRNLSNGNSMLNWPSTGKNEQSNCWHRNKIIKPRRVGKSEMDIIKQTFKTTAKQKTFLSSIHFWCNRWLVLFQPLFPHSQSIPLDFKAIFNSCDQHPTSYSCYHAIYKYFRSRIFHRWLAMCDFWRDSSPQLHLLLNNLRLIRNYRALDWIPLIYWKL